MSKRVPPIRTPGLDHNKIILEDCAARVLEINRFNKRLRVGLAFAILCGFLATTFYFVNVWKNENKALETRLETYTELRDETLQRFLTSLNNEVLLWSSHPDIVASAKHFIRDWHLFTPQEISEIRDEYIRDKRAVSLSDAHADYNIFHAENHPTLERFTRHHGYYDLFLFDLQGNLVYSVEKEDDFGHNYLAGKEPYADTGLGVIYRKALATPDHKDVVFVDFQTYTPSNGAPAAFLASRIVDETSTPIGVYAIQIPIKKFNEVLSHSQGLGETGQSYLVGQDFLMRSQSRLTQEPTMLITKIDNAAVREALAGRRAVGTSKDILGEPSIVAAMPLSFKDVNYAVATEMELKEKREPLRPYITFYLASLLFLLAFGIIAYLILRAKQSFDTNRFIDAESS